MKKLLVLLATIFLLLVSYEVYAQSKAPSFYIDKGACPFEGCVYRRWKALRTTVAYALPNLSSKIIGKFIAGSDVIALTGEVQSVPGRFVVKKRHGKYKPGDILWTYTYLGEGYVKIWFNGKWDTEDFLDETGWCELEVKGKSTWWVKIKSAVGWVGWTNLTENFCGNEEFSKFSADDCDQEGKH